MQEFKNIIFDLDKTLYPLSFDSEPLFDERCRSYLQNKLNISAMRAVDFQKQWREKYQYEADAVEKECGLSVDDFMEYICNIDMSALKENKEIDLLLKKLKARKFIFTDSSVKHVEDTLSCLGVDINHFKDIFASAHSGYIFKPDVKAYHMMLDKFKINPNETVMVEDNPKNLKTAKELGMQTIWISGKEENFPFCDYKFNDIIPVLEFLVENQS